jgi:hypothetical protein
MILRGLCGSRVFVFVVVGLPQAAQLAKLSHMSQLPATSFLHTSGGSLLIRRRSRDHHAAAAVSTSAAADDRSFPIVRTRSCPVDADGRELGDSSDSCGSGRRGDESEGESGNESASSLTESAGSAAAKSSDAVQTRPGALKLKFRDQQYKNKRKGTTIAHHHLHQVLIPTLAVSGDSGDLSLGPASGAAASHSGPIRTRSSVHMASLTNTTPSHVVVVARVWVQHAFFIRVKSGNFAKWSKSIGVRVAIIADFFSRTRRRGSETGTHISPHTLKRTHRDDTPGALSCRKRAHPSPCRSSYVLSSPLSSPRQHVSYPSALCITRPPPAALFFQTVNLELVFLFATHSLVISPPFAQIVGQFYPSRRRLGVWDEATGGQGSCVPRGGSATC